MITATIVVKGSPKSGHWKHAGVKGQLGGSAPKSAMSRAETDIRKMVDQFATLGSKRSDLAYNNYYDVVKQHGKFYDSDARIPLPKGVPKGKSKQCYRNSFDAVMASDYIYTEGLVFLEKIPIPIEHAWLTTKDGKVIDPTLPADDKAHYFGVQFNTDFVLDRAVETSYAGGILANDYMVKDSIIEHGLPEGALYNETVEKQLPINDASKQALIQIRQLMFNDDVTGLAAKVYSGEMTIGKWEESMKSLIRGLHTSVTSIKRGGWDQMSWSDWGKMGTPLREQYKYLHGFAKAIEANKDTISLKAIEARAKMYGNAAQATGDIVNTDAEIRSKLPWMPRDGSTECLVNCLCRWILQVISKTKQWQMVQAVWRLSPAEHCDTCIGRNGHTEVFYVGLDVEVPSVIGYQ